MREALELARFRSEHEEAAERDFMRYAYDPDQLGRERRNKLTTLFNTYLRSVAGRMTIERNRPTKAVPS
jgi:hypothetical protein